MVPGLTFALPAVDGPEVRLSDVVGAGPAVLVFVHADCPTSLLALRRLPAETPMPLLVIAQDSLPEAARLARRARVRARVLVDASPYAVSRAWDVTTVPTAVRVEQGGIPGARVEGWDRDALAALLGVPLADEPPSHKPGCGSRWTYDERAGGLDELEDMFERGWSDGLPVVPPTPERVEAMLGGRDPGRSLGAVPPVGGEATLERVAACAVLAGCRPEHFPLVAAAVDAALDPAFNVHGINVTTQPAAPIVIVNGPARERAGLNSGMGALGPGRVATRPSGAPCGFVSALPAAPFPAGSTARPSAIPARSASASPRTRRRARGRRCTSSGGSPPSASTVTVLACDAPLSVSDHRSRSAEELALVLGPRRRGDLEPVLVADGRRLAVRRLPRARRALRGRRLGQAAPAQARSSTRRAPGGRAPAAVRRRRACTRAPTTSRSTSGPTRSAS